MSLRIMSTLAGVFALVGCLPANKVATSKKGTASSVASVALPTLASGRSDQTGKATDINGYQLEVTSTGCRSDDSNVTKALTDEKITLSLFEKCGTYSFAISLGKLDEKSKDKLAARYFSTKEPLKVAPESFVGKETISIDLIIFLTSEGKAEGFTDDTFTKPKATDTPPPPVTDPKAQKLSFEKDVKAQVTAKCMTCHSAGKNEQPFTDHSKVTANNNALLKNMLNRMTAETNFMPQAAKDEALTKLVTKWKDDGALP